MASASLSRGGTGLIRQEELGVHIVEAVSRVRRMESAGGRPEARPVEILQRYAMGRAMIERSLAGFAPIETWEPAALLDLLDDFLEDLGHLCDRDGVAYEDIARQALGAPVRFVRIPSAEEGPPPGYAVDGDGSRTPGASAVRSALAVAYGPSASTGSHAALALAQVMRLGEEVGLDVEAAVSVGLGAWASSRDGRDGEVDWIAIPGRPTR